MKLVQLLDLLFKEPSLFVGLSALQKQDLRAAVELGEAVEAMPEHGGLRHYRKADVFGPDEWLAWIGNSSESGLQPTPLAALRLATSGQGAGT